MKVMHILNTGSFSGAENVAISIINHTSDSVNSVYVSLDGSISDMLVKSGIAYYPVKKLTISEIKRAIRDENPDVIHAHDFTASIISVLSSFSIPIISHLHNNPPWIKKLCVRSIVYGLTWFRYKKVFTVSDSVMNEYIFRKLFVKRTEIIGNPVITRDIKGKVKIADRKDCFDIVYLGRFTPQKNPELFLNIVKQVALQNPFIKVGMIGTGELFDNIQEQIKLMKLDSNISCLGFIDNPYGILNNSKLLCIPSRWEGFGLVAIEALSLGKPVVAANVGGLPNIVNDSCGKTCNDLNDYVEEINMLLTHEDYYFAKCTGALERSIVLDNEKTYFNRIMNIYERYKED